MMDCSGLLNEGNEGNESPVVEPAGLSLQVRADPVLTPVLSLCRPCADPMQSSLLGSPVRLECNYPRSCGFALIGAWC